MQDLPASAPPHYLYHVQAEWRRSESMLRDKLAPLVDAGVVPAVNFGTTTQEEFRAIKEHAGANKIAIRWAPDFEPLDEILIDWAERFTLLRSWGFEIPAVIVDTEHWVRGGALGWRDNQEIKEIATWAYGAMVLMIRSMLPDAKILCWNMVVGDGAIYPGAVSDLVRTKTIGLQRVPQGPMIDVMRWFGWDQENRPGACFLSLGNGYVIETPHNSETKVFNGTAEYPLEYSRMMSRVVRGAQFEHCVLYPSIPTDNWFEHVEAYLGGWGS